MGGHLQGHEQLLKPIWYYLIKTAHTPQTRNGSPLRGQTRFHIAICKEKQFFSPSLFGLTLPFISLSLYILGSYDNAYTLE